MQKKINKNSNDVPYSSYEDVRQKLLNRQEIALLDVREEDPHAQEHPLFAANIPLSKIELDAYGKIPRRDVPIVTLDGGEGYAQMSAQKLLELGYTDVSVLAGGIKAWRDAGGELFKDVNVPSKSFGELVESKRHTPSFSAQEVKALIEQDADIVVLDARRFDEYHTMSIPKGISVPGAELVLRVAELAPNPNTQVIVNCAGRTRSIIGTQSLINAGIPNPVRALRNGTIGWTLAGQTLEKGQDRRFGEVSVATQNEAAVRARSVADKAGVKRASMSEIAQWKNQDGRTTYFFDTRTPEEFEAGHLAEFRSTPGGQLVQETEMVAPVRGARLVLTDSDGVRANMTASWLAQMAWDVYVLDDIDAKLYTEVGPWKAPLPTIPEVQSVAATTLSEWLKVPGVVVIDVDTHANYLRGHIPSSFYALRSQLALALSQMPHATRYVVTSPDGLLARLCAVDLASLTSVEIFVLEGGTRSWAENGLALELGPTHLASPPLDRYKRPYEGTNNAKEAMQGYLDWEFGLVDQLGKDGTHHFWVL